MWHELNDLTDASLAICEGSDYTPPQPAVPECNPVFVEALGRPKKALLEALERPVTYALVEKPKIDPEVFNFRIRHIIALLLMIVFLWTTWALTLW